MSDHSPTVTCAWCGQLVKLARNHEGVYLRPERHKANAKQCVGSSQTVRVHNNIHAARAARKG